MVRYALTACLLLLPGLAAGQGDQFTLISPIVNNPMGVAFPLDMDAIVGEANAVVEIPLRADAADSAADGALVKVEEEGVRMPEETFSLD